MTDEHAEPWPVTEAEYRAKLHAEAIARTVLTGIEVTERRRWTTAETVSQARTPSPEQQEPSPRG